MGEKYQPDSMIPFLINREQAIERLKVWAKKEKNIPAELTDDKVLQKIEQLYFPCWVIDCEAYGSFEGEASNQEETWRYGDEEYTRTNYYHISRDGNVKMRGLMREASGNIYPELPERMRPYDLGKAVRYAPESVTNVRVIEADISRDSLQQEVRQYLMEAAGRAVGRTVKQYDSVSTGNCGGSITEESWKCVLFPVWIAAGRSNSGKTCYAAVNGQTGAVGGVYPLEKELLFRKTRNFAGIVFLVSMIVHMIWRILLKW